MLQMMPTLLLFLFSSPLLLPLLLLWLTQWVRVFPLSSALTSAKRFFVDSNWKRFWRQRDLNQGKAWLSATVGKILLTAIRDFRITLRRSWKRSFGGRSIITPSLDLNPRPSNIIHDKLDHRTTVSCNEKHLFTLSKKIFFFASSRSWPDKRV